MNYEEIVDYIIKILPSVLTILTVILTTVKTIGNFNDLKQKVMESKEATKLRDDLRIVLNENAELKEDIKKLIEKIDKIRAPKEISNESNNKEK